jgi:hypothetical protein
MGKKLAGRWLWSSVAVTIALVTSGLYVLRGDRFGALLCGGAWITVAVLWAAGLLGSGPFSRATLRDEQPGSGGDDRHR